VRYSQVLLLEEEVNEVLQCRRGVAADFDGLSTAHWALGLLLVLECVRVDRLVARVHPGSHTRGQ
jgi:hypothetical protein